uniref:Uncharacterized protein n=1 Tax=Trichobilharzia regenti TaxID=157069 RepID=A0AA85JC10_TRIRE|nr:unnamed protein product [Trichobilharzia regenti]
MQKGRAFHILKSTLTVNDMHCVNMKYFKENIVVVSSEEAIDISRRYSLIQLKPTSRITCNTVLKQSPFSLKLE